jgi:hypothetical protein
VWLCLALAACAGGSSSAASATATPSSTSADTGTPGSQSTPSGPTSTPIDLGTPGAVLGTTDACSAQGKPSASPPSNIPIYANAQLTIGSIEGTSGVFGLCSTDSVDTIDAFYAAQLPASGWQNITNDPLAAARQLTGSQSNTNLIVTILPDTQPGKTDVLIIYSGA